MLVLLVLSLHLEAGPPHNPFVGWPLGRALGAPRKTFGATAVRGAVCPPGKLKGFLGVPETLYEGDVRV